MAGFATVDTEFQVLLERSREAYRERVKTYVEAGGDRLLGSAPTPEELERET